VLSAKRETTYRPNERKTIPMKLSTIESRTTTAATATRSLHCFEFIHFQLQLATTLFVIALVLSKLVSLAEGNTTTMSDADHVGQKESRESTAAATTTTTTIVTTVPL